MRLEVNGEAVLVRGERFLLARAVANLVQNAVDFSPKGGRVHVAVRREAERVVAVVVEDDGPGVPEFARERIFERFYSLPRPHSGRKSSGLGLSFVREVADLHEGSVRVENRAEGGARATLMLRRSG